MNSTRKSASKASYVTPGLHKPGFRFSERGYKKAQVCMAQRVCNTFCLEQYDLHNKYMHLVLFSLLFPLCFFRQLLQTLCAIQPLTHLHRASINFMVEAML